LFKAGDFMETVKLLTIFGLATLELWVAIPAGFAMNAHPVAIGVATAVGATLGVVIVVLLGDRFRTWLLGRKRKNREDDPLKAKEGGRQETIEKIWNRYGVAGLGLLAPLITGAPLGAALGIALGAPVGKLLFWMTVGVILWSTLLTTVGALGISIFCLL
jgi:hypothetical protein